jgi:hypothetical protein
MKPKSGQVQQMAKCFAPASPRAYVKHAEVTVPSLADWEKNWQENPQRSAQPKLVSADHDVTAASRPVTAFVPVQIRLVTPISTSVPLHA